LDNAAKWDGYEYTVNQANQAIEVLNKQVDKHNDHEFIKDSLKKRITLYSLYAEKIMKKNTKD
jgi:hypothetical protein